MMNIQKLFKLAFSGNKNMVNKKKSVVKVAKKTTNKAIKKSSIKNTVSKKQVSKSSNNNALNVKSQELAVPRPVPMHECPVCGSLNVFYNKERAELICRDCGEIHAQII